MKSKYSLLSVLVTVLASVFFAGAIASASDVITSGTFGVAWLDDDGVVRVFDGQVVTEPITDVKITTILAADVLEENTDQLLFLDSAKQSLHIYSFKTKKVLGPFGSNVKTFAAGRYAADDSYLSVFACTHRGDTFRWTKEIMDKKWQSLSGQFSQTVSGKFSNRQQADDFAVIAEGNIYMFSTKWQTYSMAVEGKGAIGFAAGNFTASAGDEIVFWDKSGSAFLLQNQSVEDLKQKIICAVAGKNGRNGDVTDSLYALNKMGKPVVYDRASKSWKDVPFKNAFACTSLITLTNANGNGHELFVVGKNDLYQITADGTAKQLSDQKTTKIFLTSNGKIIADYRFNKVRFKPYIEKLRTPSGRNILRDAPYDHLHHHGLMFAIAVNGCNFWEEFTPKHGKEITVSINPQPDKETSSLESELDWKDGESKTLIKENRKISVSTISAEKANENVTLLDWQTTLKTDDKGVILDKSNHHYFGLGLRFDQTMDKSGRFFSDSETNKSDSVRGDERLTPCKWMAYTAKLNGEPVTVAVFGYPSNPIPTMAFTMGDAGKSFAYLGITLNLHRQPVEMKPNSTLTFRYRVAVWDGEVTPETIEKLLPTR